MASKFTASGVSLVNTSGTVTAYRAPDFTNASGCVVVLSSLIGNAYDGDFLATLDIRQGASYVSTIIDQVVIPSGASLETIPNKIVLLSGQSLNLTASVSGKISTTTSVLEIY